jgi:hypothetical protein
LAGCSNLVSIALVQTSPLSTMENQWFNDLAVAQPTTPCGQTQFGCDNQLLYFYFPATPGTNSTSAAACSHLANIGWHLAGF